MAEARKTPGRNEKALVKTLTALRATDRLTDEHAALIASASTLAEAVDAAPGSDAMWREYRLALKALMEATKDDAGDPDEDAGFLDAVRTPMGNATKS